MNETDNAQDTALEETVAPESQVDTAPLSPLEEEGEIAADYIEELLDTADIDGDIDIEVRDGRTYVSVVAEDDDADLRALVGQDGEIVEALQELARLSVLSATQRRSRLILDVAGHRDERAAELRSLADDAVPGSARTARACTCRPCPRTSARSCTTPWRRPGWSPSPRATALGATS